MKKNLKSTSKHTKALDYGLLVLFAGVAAIIGKGVYDLLHSI